MASELWRAIQAPGDMHPQTGPQSFAPRLPPPPYAPVGVGGWHFPGLDALEGALALHHHAQVGVPVGIVALGLRGAVGPTGPTRGK